MCSLSFFTYKASCFTNDLKFSNNRTLMECALPKGVIGQFRDKFLNSICRKQHIDKIGFIRSHRQLALTLIYVCGEYNLDLLGQPYNLRDQLFDEKWPLIQLP